MGTRIVLNFIGSRVTSSALTASGLEKGRPTLQLQRRQDVLFPSYTRRLTSVRTQSPTLRFKNQALWRVWVKTMDSTGFITCQNSEAFIIIRWSLDTFIQNLINKSRIRNFTMPLRGEVMTRSFKEGWSKRRWKIWWLSSTKSLKK